MNVESRLLVTLLIAAAACGAPESAQPAVEILQGQPAARASGATGDQVVERHLSVAERALLRGYHATLRSPAVREASHEFLLRQLRRNPPVAFVDGYWATPVDLSLLFELPAVRAALAGGLPEGPSGEEASALLADPNRLRQLAAFAFTASPLRAQLGLADVGRFERVAASEPAAVGVFVAPVKDVEWAVVEYLPPPGAAEDECYFYCGDPETWDFDGDGRPDLRDEDRDNDGVPDDEDDFPYLPGATDCKCDAQAFLVFVTKFATGIADAVLAAHALVDGRGETSRGVALGAVPEAEDSVEFVFPAALLPLEDRPGAAECPDPSDPTVRYVSSDPADCARIRFRCAEGEVSFYNLCGCGCQRP